MQKRTETDHCPGHLKNIWAFYPCHPLPQRALSRCLQSFLGNDGMTCLGKLEAQPSKTTIIP